MIEQLERKRLQQGLAEATHELTLRLHPAADLPKANEKLAEAAREIEVAAAGKLVVRPGDSRGLPALPALSLQAAGRDNIRYLALPEGQEAAPFIDLLVALGRGTRPEGDWADGLQRLERPAEVLVFIAAACPHCPQAVRSALQLALASDAVRVAVIDAQFYEALAGRYKVRSVPTTVIDGGYTTIGVQPAPTLARQLIEREQPETVARAFHSMLDSGRVDAAAVWLAAGTALPAFVHAWRGSTTAARVGLMLCGQKALEQSRGALDPAVGDLIELLEADDAALRGDTADLLGQIGHPDAAGPIKKLLDDTNPDVAEIAEEALDGIMERSGEQV
jgi:alkyl hydroperoxide reductase subunit AhpF